MASFAFGFFLPAVLASSSVEIPSREIAPGVFMPVISIGTGGLESKSAYNITSRWLELGGRGVDTAYVYRDQSIVAKAIGDSGLKREDIFITTKIPGCFLTEHFVDKDLQELGTDYLDLLLLHSPEPSFHCGAAWAVLETLHSKGVIKAIGVSNFKRANIESLMKSAKVVPAVNQIQHNILEPNDDMVSCSLENNITVEAYSPLGRSGHSGDISGNPTIKGVAAKHNVSVYQVALKWILQHNHMLTFQSTSEVHQASDANLFGFNLTEADMSSLDGLSKAEYIVV